MTETTDLSARIMIVDRSEVAQSIISHILQKEMQDAYIVTCGSAEEAMEKIKREKFDLITTALQLPGLDGLDLCHEVRKNPQQHNTPVIIVSSDADSRLLKEGFSAGVTDYFNKSRGYRELVEFIKDVSQRHAGLVGRILYVEDSASTALSTRQLMQQHGLQITQVSAGEEALDLLKKNVKEKGEPGFDVVFTDFFLSEQMTGGDLLYAIRAQLHYSLQELPVLVVTIPDNEDCQADIFHAGANDFITKPVVEEVLIARLKSLLMIRHQYNVLKRYSKDMYQLATTDALTGVRNKQFLLTEGPDFVKKRKLLSLLMMDIDNLEEINEEHGDIIGDHILHMVGQFLQTHFSEEDSLVSRFGGRRFCILLADMDLAEGRGSAEGLRQNITALRPEGIPISASIGLASSESMGEATLGALMEDADKALLFGLREKGMNQVSVCTVEKNFE